MLDFKPLCRDFGLEASGIDLSEPLSDDLFAEVEAALYRGQVLVIRGQSLTPESFVAFARRFGRPEPHPDDRFHHPEDPNVLILSNVVVDDEPQGLDEAGTHFQTDHSWLEVPARATLLYSIEVPAAGGHTMFANQYAAYDDLPAFMKERIGTLAGLHRAGRQRDPGEASEPAAAEPAGWPDANLPPVSHPIVRAHPVTGRKALYAVAGSSFGIAGMSDEEARALLDLLAAHATQYKYRYSHAYRVGDVVICDNASLLHSTTPTDPDESRTLWRITVKEPQASGAAAMRGPRTA